MLKKKTIGDIIFRFKHKKNRIVIKIYFVKTLHTVKCFTNSNIGRSFAQLRRLLTCSDAVVSLWRGKRLVGFGRASSDGFSRAVLWDIVVAGDLQGHGLGRRVIEELLHAPPVVGVERVYLMTTNSAGFYRQLGFKDASPQQLMVLRR